MKRHEKKPYSIAETHRREKSLGEYTSLNFEEMERNVQKMYKCQDCSYSTNWSSNLRRHEKFKHQKHELNEKLENYLESYVEKFYRKIELGRNVRIIINKRGFNMHALPENMKKH